MKTIFYRACFERHLVLDIQPIFSLLPETTKASFQNTFELSTLCNFYKDGGFKSADILNKFRSNHQRYSVKTLAYVFFREFFEIFKNTFFTAHLWTCSWTKRLYDNITPCWEIIPVFFIKK